MWGQIGAMDIKKYTQIPNSSDLRTHLRGIFMGQLSHKVREKLHDELICGGVLSLIGRELGNKVYRELLETNFYLDTVER
jgi:hypothetical protein